MDPVQRTMSTRVGPYLEQYYALAMPRHHKLFDEFLPLGYEGTSLSSVKQGLFEQAQAIKLLLGIFITLSDDFSEHPDYIHSSWVSQLIAETSYNDKSLLEQSRTSLDEQSLNALNLATSMYKSLLQSIREHAIHPELISVIEFDFQQYYQCLNYSVLITKEPLLACGIEYRHYSPHNMGMIIAGMIDLSLSKDYSKSELPKIRHIFYIAQRLGHICNTLSTLNREISQGDINNEISLQILQKHYPENIPLSQISALSDELIKKLSEERERHYTHINTISLNSFSVSHYLNGLKQLQELHERLEEYI